MWTTQAAGLHHDYIWTGTTALAGEKHLGFYLTPDGRLAIVGSYLFWSQFLIYVPNRKYQRIFGLERKFLSLSASAGYEMGVLSGPGWSQEPAIVETYAPGLVWSMNDFDPNADDIAYLRLNWTNGPNLWKDKAHIWIGANCPEFAGPQSER